MQNISSGFVPDGGHVVKKERETKMTMEVSGIAAHRKNVCDVLVNLAMKMMQSGQDAGDKNNE